MPATLMPPTTHALPPTERLRLMRSTRKLAAMLGETPLLVDAPASPPPSRQAHARSLSTLDTAGRPSMAPAAIASLWRSASTAAAHSPHGAPRPLLVIALPTAFASAADSVAASSFEAPPSPSTPASARPLDADADAARRRKLAKLSRTLGAHVPPALVFPATTGRRRASTLSVPDAVRAHLRAAPARTSSDTDASGASRDSQQRLLPRAAATGADTGEAAMHRRERGWSGEWAGSVHSMDDVVRGLRQMRVQ